MKGLGGTDGTDEADEMRGMAPMARIELATSPLPRERSATELHGRLGPPEPGGGSGWERVKGIEPSF